MKIVLDTNVLVSGIFWTGVPATVLSQWINDRFELLLTDEIFDEYIRTLFRISKGKNDDLVNKWLILFAENSTFVTVKKRFNLSPDPDDNKFIECAVSGNADFIVSGDSHLLDLKSILNTEVITPSVFLKKF
jgi:putative PIN family toxin of toxin-antitoxin system